MRICRSVLDEASYSGTRIDRIPSAEARRSARPIELPRVDRPGRFARRPGGIGLAWAAALLIVIVGSSPASAWDQDGHVIITRLACSRLPDKMPDWVRSEEARSRLEYLSNEPDRWRGQHNTHLDHVNGPEHYFDVETLGLYDLDLLNLPPLRREFLDRLATRRASRPQDFPTYDRSKDRDYTQRVPGLLPYRIAELEWQIAACWTTLMTYEAHRDLVTEEMLRNARENILYLMGILSHYVGDGCQPLHTTEHHHGWEGPNPKGYTTNYRFHQYIDDGIVLHHRITAESLLAQMPPPKAISTDGYWREICAYLNDTHTLVEPLYAMEKSGELREATGKKFIEDCFLEGASMLAGIWIAAYEGGHIDDFRVNQLKEQRRRERERSSAASDAIRAPVPTTQPAEATPVTQPKEAAPAMRSAEPVSTGSLRTP